MFPTQHAGLLAAFHQNADGVQRRAKDDDRGVVVSEACPRSPRSVDGSRQVALGEAQLERVEVAVDVRVLRRDGDRVAAQFQNYLFVFGNKG